MHKPFGNIFAVCLLIFFVFVSSTGCSQKQRLNKIQEAMAPVANGEGISEAVSYNDEAPGPHKMIVIYEDGSPHEWSELLPNEWRPSSIKKTEIVLLVSPEKEFKLGTQQYMGGPDITRYRYAVEIEGREARTGKTLWRDILWGSMPKPFPETASADVTRIDGEHVKYGDLEAWLACRVTPKSCDVLDVRASHEIESVAFSPDGDTLLVGGNNYFRDETVSLWRISDGALLREWAHDGELIVGELSSTIIRVAYSPNGQIVASSGTDNAIRLWQVSDGKLVNEILSERYALCLNFSPDGQIIAAGMSDDTIQFWQVSDSSELNVLKGHSKLVYSIAFSPDGRMLASGSRDGSIRLWQVSDGSELNVLEGNSDPVTSIAFSPDGRILASGSIDGTVRLWQIPDGSLDKVIELIPVKDDPIRPGRKLEPRLSSLAFSSDGQVLVAGSYNATVHLIRVSDGEQLQVFEDFSDQAYISAVAFSPNDRLVAIALLGLVQLRVIK